MTIAISRHDLAKRLLQLAQELDDRANNLWLTNAEHQPISLLADPTTCNQVHDLDNLLQAAESLADYLVKS